MSTYFYGFKNKDTGLFKRDYRTCRYKTKTACFKTKHRAEEALTYQRDKDDYVVSEMIITEDK